MAYELFDVVTSLISIPSEGVRVGQAGAIVEIFHNPDAFYVEFCNNNGETLAMLAMTADQITHADLRKAA